MTHRVRILRSGIVQTVVEIDDYDTACAWAMETMQLDRSLDGDGIWAATLETGYLFVDPFGDAPDLFVSNHELHEGFVLDKAILHNPEIDVQSLFGMK